MRICSLLLILVVFGCGQKLSKTPDLPKNVKTNLSKKRLDQKSANDTVFRFFVPEGKAREIRELKKENHLLRVEIDRLKAEAKKLKKLVEINEMATKLEKGLKRVKREIKE